MTGRSSGLRRWTYRFVLASAGSFVAFQALALSDVDPATAALVGVLGFVCPMVFGMGYLLFPSFVGETLIDRRFAGVHFGLAYAGLGLLAFGRLSGRPDGPAALAGVGLWSLGAVVFLAAISATVVVAVRGSPETARRALAGGDQAARVATATIPVAAAFLLFGTVALVAATVPPEAAPAAMTPITALSTAVVPDVVGVVTLPRAVHLIAIGFGALPVYAVGIRLLPGFFHTGVPGPLAAVVLPAGVVAPALLGAARWVDPWFGLGAAAAVIAMVGYLAIVAVVIGRADRRRVGAFGVLLGAIAGVAAVLAAATVAFGGLVVVTPGTALAIHRALVLGGFFPLTIAGYAFLFFPVASGRYPGASARTARTTVVLLAAGAGCQAIGLLLGTFPVRCLGGALSILGGFGYAFLLGARFLQD
ncbi:hypothetical protein [Halopenitus persicus]|uniref:hypothetical protein n=1 Tax=Halopenitus persicus TaxID=1048396 RepID=UPI000BBB1CA6|nr:hypothetical protein [Halopenitus persicus]